MFLDSGTRKQSDYAESEPAKRKKPDTDNISDLIVLGLPYSSVEEDLRKYFEKFGELEMHEVRSHVKAFDNVLFR